MRIATFLAALVLAVATPAPAGACVVCCMPAEHYFAEPPADLDGNELVLEVRPEGAEKISSPSDDHNGATWLHRFSVVRVVHGRFDGDAVSILFSSDPCQAYFAPLPDGVDTGLLVGFAMPSSSDQQETPGLALRYPNGPIRREPIALATTVEAMAGDPAAIMKVVRAVRDPVVKKFWFDRAIAILRTRTDAGDTSAMMDLGFALRVRPSTDFKAMVDQISNPHDPAREWLERASMLGNTNAMYLVAETYYGRRGEGLSLYKRAAEAGHACAMGRLAQHYRFGWGTPKNQEQALAWYRKAIAAGAIMSPYGYEIEGDPPPGAPYTPQLKCPGER